MLRAVPEVAILCKDVDVVAGATTPMAPVIKGEVSAASLVKRRPVPNPPLQRTRSRSPLNAKSLGTRILKGLEPCPYLRLPRRKVLSHAFPDWGGNARRGCLGLLRAVPEAAILCKDVDGVAGATIEKTPVIKGGVRVAFLVKRRPVPNPPLQRTRYARR